MRIDPGFEQMYRAEYGSVFRAVYLLCGDQAMAEDATQEAFARALERWRRLEGRSWAAGWVVTTALNISRRALRRRPEPVAVEKNPSPDPDELLDLRMAVRALPPRLANGKLEPERPLLGGGNVGPPEPTCVALQLFFNF